MAGTASISSNIRMQILVELEDESMPPPRTNKKNETKGEGKAKQKGKKVINSMATNILGQEPMKTFLHLAQQEFRVYIALENAWPRVKDGHIEKIEKPLEAMAAVIEKYDKYKTKAFQAIYKEAFEDEAMKAKMVRYVCHEFVLALAFSWTLSPKRSPSDTAGTNCLIRHDAAQRLSPQPRASVPRSATDLASFRIPRIIPEPGSILFDSILLHTLPLRSAPL